MKLEARVYHRDCEKSPESVELQSTVFNYASLEVNSSEPESLTHTHSGRSVVSKPKLQTHTPTQKEEDEERRRHNSRRMKKEK